MDHKTTVIQKSTTNHAVARDFVPLVLKTILNGADRSGLKKNFLEVKKKKQRNYWKYN